MITSLLEGSSQEDPCAHGVRSWVVMSLRDLLLKPYWMQWASPGGQISYTCSLTPYVAKCVTNKKMTLAIFNENLRWFEKCHATSPPRTSILHNVTKKQFIVSAASKEGGKLKGPAGDEKTERGSFPHNFHTTPCFLHFHSSTAQRPEVCSEYTCTQGTTVGLGGKAKDS